MTASGWVVTGGRARTTTVGDVLDTVTQRLGARDARDGAEHVADSARDLIAAVLDVPRFWPSAHRSRALKVEELEAIARAVDRMLAGMPIEYATGRATFRLLTLDVDENVLIPRPETEGLVDLVLDLTDGGKGTAIDVGTGCGAIALSLAVEGAFGRVLATDVSVGAVAISRANADHIRAVGGAAGRTLTVVPEFRVGAGLAPCQDVRADVIVSNPPYIAWSEAGELPSSVRDWEPPIALFAAEDGLAVIAQLAREAASILVPSGLLALEVDSRRAGRAAATVQAVGAYRDIEVRPDLSGRARYVVAYRLEEE